MVVLVTFADSTLSHSSKRLVRQARRMKVFSKIYAFDESSLEKNFALKHRDTLSRSVRGFGYWIWKPQVILQCLDVMSAQDILVYLDVGCHLNKAGTQRLFEYFSMVSQSEMGILAFNLVHRGHVIHREEQWTKGDTLKFFGFTSNLEIMKSAQIEGTVIIIQKRDSSVSFIQNWLRIMEDNPSLVDDSVSSFPNHIDFVENRHDQSIFSLLGKSERIDILPVDENYPVRQTRFTRKLAWRDLKKMPIHAKRDKDRFLTKMSRDSSNIIKSVYAAILNR